jgi:hypothetical protein
MESEACFQAIVPEHKFSCAIRRPFPNPDGFVMTVGGKLYNSALTNSFLHFRQQCKFYSKYSII